MPRQLKPQPVGEPIRDDVLGVEIQIFLDRNDLTFFAKFEDQTYEAKDADTVRRQVANAMKAARSLSWIPVIEVRLKAEFARGDENMVGFDLNRFWIARKGDGAYLESKWENDTDADRIRRSGSHYIPKDRRDNLTFPLRIEHNSSYGTEVLLAYSEEVWTGLEKIQAAINEARERLETILATPEGIAQIASLAIPQLLPAPSYGSTPPGGVYARYIKAGIRTSADFLTLKPGEDCPECRRAFNPADVADFEGDNPLEGDFCQTCGMLFFSDPFEYQPPPPDPSAVVELSSWDYSALSLIQARGLDITSDEWDGIKHLSDDLTSRGLIVFDGADVPFLTPKGINSLAAADPAKVSNPPLEIVPGDGGTAVLRPQQPPIQIQGRRPSRGTPQEAVGGGETEDGQPYYLTRPRAADDADDHPPYDSPFAHHSHCPKRWGGTACLCNALDADDALE